ncbi:DUF2264 domain-containing protein [Microbacterium capsulatum]|uniref:DUF2264 domain-containing protein n=1 Tax=Microbacterium capsulatum TaxID=3041921 RepID=A0ABU0XL43_9MICO|nr:DUF2264 domain-containing protein [Microbacterium sp. ASV81]MDQ4215833.1 DUF2264 domain-containing protein [Microbacterium sp. ASV81]
MTTAVAPDPVLSPFTGWGRAHWEAVADDWLGQIRRYDSPGGGLPRLPGRVTGDGERRESMETVGRSFLLGSARIAGAADPGAPEVQAHLDWYSRALLAGTRPGGAEEWPRGVTCRLPLTGITNSIVESANIGFSLYVCRDRLWAGLTRPEQQQIADWLRHHARCEVWQNNWQLFPAMAEGFLRSVGEEVTGTTSHRNVARVESWYLGDGWYTDGPEHAIDYYNAWAIHPYLWAWYRMTDTVQTPEGQRHLERLRDFTASQAHMFASDGSVLHQGRSLTYRTALLAALWCADESGVSALTPGQTRRIASGVLSRFTAQGVGVGGPLSLGWYHEFEPVLQDYSGFGSPYLAGIGFLGLAQPASAPVWTAPEEAQPSDGGPFVRPIEPAGWVLRAASDGIVRMANHGSDHATLPVGEDVDRDDPHYAKFGYTTHTAPGTGPAWADAIDAHFALVDAEGNGSRRSALRATRVEGALSGSVHVPQFDRRALPGCAVTTVTASDDVYEVRAHLVETDRPWTMREGGYAVADDVEPTGGTFDGGAWVRGRDGLLSAVVGLHGWDTVPVPESAPSPVPEPVEGSSARIFAYRDANAMGPHSATPAVFGTTGTGRTVVVTLHVLERGGPADPRHWRDQVALRVDGTRIHLTWASGGVDEFDLATFLPWDGHAGLTGPRGEAR